MFEKFPSETVKEWIDKKGKSFVSVKVQPSRSPFAKSCLDELKKEKVESKYFEINVNAKRHFNFSNRII